MATEDRVSGEKTDLATVLGEPGLRLPILLVGLLVVCLVFLRVLPRDRPLLRAIVPLIPGAHLRSDQHAPVASANADPVVGTHLPLPQQAIPAGNVSGAGTKSSQPLLVIMAGACSSCVLSPLLRIQDLADRHRDLRVLVVAQSKREAIATFRSRHGLRLPMFADADGTLTRQYNATWTPRAYLLSENGSLLWLQRGGVLEPSQIPLRSLRSLSPQSGEVR